VCSSSCATIPRGHADSQLAVLGLAHRNFMVMYRARLQPNNLSLMARTIATLRGSTTPSWVETSPATLIQGTKPFRGRARAPARWCTVLHQRVAGAVFNSDPGDVKGSSGGCSHSRASISTRCDLDVISLNPHP